MPRQPTALAVLFASLTGLAAPAHASVIYSYTGGALDYCQSVFSNAGPCDTVLGRALDPSASTLSIELTDDAFLALQGGESISWQPDFDFSPGFPLVSNLDNAPFERVSWSNLGDPAGVSASALAPSQGVFIDISFSNDLLGVDLFLAEAASGDAFAFSEDGDYFIGFADAESPVTFDDGTVYTGSFFGARFSGGAWQQVTEPIEVPAPGGPLLLLVGAAALFRPFRRINRS